MSISTAEISLSRHHTDETGAKIGMWLFLFTELLLFSGMFLLYAVYRSKHSVEFHNAALELNVLMGTVNTMVLLTSSLTVALSIEALRRKQRKRSIILLLATIFFGFVFLVIKYYEWSAKIHHGIYPGSEQLINYSKGEILFFGLYYTMTGIHGLHVIVGMVVLSFMLYFIARRPKDKILIESKHIDQLRGGKLVITDSKGNAVWHGQQIDDSVTEVDIVVKHPSTPEFMDKHNEIKLENAGLYWHLVDIIWIFLFPLFYLIT